MLMLQVSHEPTNKVQDTDIRSLYNSTASGPPERPSSSSGLAKVPTTVAVLVSEVLLAVQVHSSSQVQPPRKRGMLQRMQRPETSTTNYKSSREDPLSRKENIAELMTN
jgi:hypothetical protein